MNIKKGYVCCTTWDWHMGEGNDPSPQKVYPTIEDLKNQESCWEECGIYELEVKLEKLIAIPKGWLEIE